MASILEEIREQFPSVFQVICFEPTEDFSSILSKATNCLIKQSPSDFVRFLSFWHEWHAANTANTDDSFSCFNVFIQQTQPYVNQCIDLYYKNQQTWDTSSISFEKSVLDFMISKGCDVTLEDSTELNDSLKLSLIKNRPMSLVKYIYYKSREKNSLILHKRNIYKVIPIRIAIRYYRDPIDLIEFFIDEGSPIENLDSMDTNLLHILHGILLDLRDTLKRDRYFALYDKFNFLKDRPRLDGLLPLHSLFALSGFGTEEQFIMDKLFDLLMPSNANVAETKGETILMAFLSKKEWWNTDRFNRLLSAGADVTVGGTLARAIVSGGSNLLDKISAVEAAGAVFNETDVEVFFDHIFIQPSQRRSVRSVCLQVFRDKLMSLPDSTLLASTMPDLGLRVASVYLVINRTPPPFDLIVKLIEGFGVDINYVKYHEQYNDTSTFLLELLSPFRRLESEDALSQFLTRLIDRYPHIDLDRADLGAEFELPYQIALTREAFIASAILIKQFARLSNALPRNLFVSKADDFAYFIKTIVAAGLDRNTAIATVGNAQMLNGQRRSQLIEWIVEFTTHRVKSLTEIVALSLRRTRDRQAMLQIVNYLPWTERTMSILFLDHIHN